MGIFVDSLRNGFAGLSNTAQTIVAATENVLWVTSISICNRGAAPIRINLQRQRIRALVLEPQCYAATISNLTITYSNGTAGVGATLTNAATLGAFTVDGVSPILNARILVKNQTSTFQNGIYTLTTVGSVSVAWVLTRATDFNSPTEITRGDLIPITNGTANANTKWLQTAVIVTVGTDPIIFTLNIPDLNYLLNDLEIAPRSTKNLIEILDVINLEYSISPYITDSLICFSNGYIQKFDCNVNYTRLNELPLTI